jgi:hypothetical protein
MFDRGLLLAERLALRDPALARGLYDALAEPFSVRLAEYGRRRTRLGMIRVPSLRDRCVEVLAPFEPHPIWEEEHLAWRAVCYERYGHPLHERALRDYEEFLEASPPKLSQGLPPAAP